MHTAISIDVESEETTKCNRSLGLTIIIILSWFFITFNMYWDRIKDDSFEYNSILSDRDSVLFVNTTGCRIQVRRNLFRT